MSLTLLACGGGSHLGSSPASDAAEESTTQAQNNDSSVDVVALVPEVAPVSSDDSPQRAPASQPAVVPVPAIPPEPIVTPEPTNSPEPIVTPEPTNSPEPTFTPEPASTLSETVSESPTAAVVEPDPVFYNTLNGRYQITDITDLILVTGQSNALGAGTTFDASIDTPHERVMAYTEHGWQVADLHQVWDQGWHPGNDGSAPPSNNFAFHFGKKIAEMTGDDRVFGFVLATAPGQPISHWEPAGEFYQSLQRKVTAALAAHPGKSTIDGILWHQGESDANGGPDYARQLDDLISTFRHEPWYLDQSPFICGETAQFAVNQQLNALNHDGDPWTACVAAAGLPTHEDGAHFLAEALRTMGLRYALAYNAMWWQLPR